jgi:hypothetical protein
MCRVLVAAMLVLVAAIPDAGLLVREPANLIVRRYAEPTKWRLPDFKPERFVRYDGGGSHERFIWAT